MPNNKIFEALNMRDYLMGMMTGRKAEPKKLTMYEAAEAYYKQVISFMEMLETNKTITYEHTKTGALYRWQRKGIDQFVMEVLEDNREPQKFNFTANDVLNMIFKHVPFITLIGTETEMNL